MREKYAYTPLGFWNLNIWAYIPPVPFVPHVLHMVLVTLGFEGVPHWDQYAWLLVFIAVFLLMQEYWHKHFHYAATPWRKYKLFREMRWVHYLHHRGDFRHNYGIIDMWMDVLSGSYIMNL